MRIAKRANTKMSDRAAGKPDPLRKIIQHRAGDAGRFLLNTYEKKDVSIELYQERGTLEKDRQWRIPVSTGIPICRWRRMALMCLPWSTAWMAKAWWRSIPQRTADASCSIRQHVPSFPVRVTPDGKQVLICTVSGTQVTENQDGYVEDDNKGRLHRHDPGNIKRNNCGSRRGRKHLFC